VPYAVLSPGPTFNTLGSDPYSTTGSQVIVIDGRKANATAGHLNMTTVSEQDDSVSAFQALVGWLRGDRIVLPRTAVIPPGQSEQQQNEQNTADFTSSQDNATTAALCELGYPKGFGILGVAKGGAADGVLQPGDELVSVDGTATASADALSRLMQSETPGKSVTVVVKRQAKALSRPVRFTTLSVPVTLGAPPQGRKSGAGFGITVSDTCLAPFTVTINLEEVGGPSAGLMFALGIMDKVGTVDLTKGQFIAGTGEIEASGKVDPIGGIALKMIAAKNHGATVFLAPSGNCSDVRKATPKGLEVVKITSLHDAVQSLVRIQKHESVPSC
jgi:PDZ domain-containing protein